MAEFDLDNPPPDEDESPAARRRRARRQAKTESPPSRSSKPAGGSRVEQELSGRLVTAFGKLADQLEKRGDPELPDALRDEAPVMAQSLVSLTRTVKWLRSPLVLFLTLLEPVLAFWRVGSILLGRLFTFRDRVVAERAEAQAAWEAEQNAARAAEGLPIG